MTAARCGGLSDTNKQDVIVYRPHAATARPFDKTRLAECTKKYRSLVRHRIGHWARAMDSLFPDRQIPERPIVPKGLSFKEEKNFRDCLWDEDEVFRFAIDYAPKDTKGVKAGALRVGAITPHNVFKDKITWYEPAQFFRRKGVKKQLKSSSQLQGFAKINKRDRTRICAMIVEATGPSASKFSKKS